MEQLYEKRLDRYTTAMRNEQPDRVPIRPFVAEFTGTYAGYTCQELAHDYENAFAAARKCASDFEWDAVVPNMLATWTGMTQAMGLRYYMTPGIDLPADVGHQYREPSPEAAWMKPDEYDALIEDPTGFLYNVWFPRVAEPLSPIGGPVTFEHNLALIKGPMAMMQFFQGWGVQEGRLRDECGMPSAIAGMLRAPMDFIADKLRGYLGLVDDLYERPEKVQAACEALMPYLTQFALATADPNKNIPIGFWMHRGCVPFISFDHFNNLFWPTLKPVVQELWAHGHQTLFYAEGNWDHHLEAFAELPDRSIVYHVDQGDVLKVHEALGDKFCLSGGISNYLLGFRSPEEVRQECKRVIEAVGRDGGYIMDASAIVQRDAKVENIRAMTEATLEYGVYSQGHTSVNQPKGAPKPTAGEAMPGKFVSTDGGRRPPGMCVSWPEKRATLPPIQGDEALCERIWQSVDGLAAMYIWWIALAF
jgi:methoxylated aromatic compound---corrinoid protein Co-methyltransferase